MKNHPYPTVCSSRIETKKQFWSFSDSVNQVSIKVIDNVDREIAARFDIDWAIEKAKQQRIDAWFSVNK